MIICFIDFQSPIRLIKKYFNTHLFGYIILVAYNIPTYPGSNIMISNNLDFGLKFAEKGHFFMLFS